ncbi:non-hydrolyzing UDP-N-acetylglucosamine 2-epimerase [Bacteroides sp. 224]|uniref:non-hydrolyzing UDP-N-acetylglucosamine 2-epimerase n=1 Tax=Bacteroides sp. 224 TaxID=2302936 RepID=UPI0013CF51AC|nr:UDP-N-acetylglucosamine 2-epimerase (non-hydrolyzing) [Bacteroides sp. 224]NDV66992.1 UDP-N-acetylglucosamine 2-epimerase (non-hydrolyzing) [Bacteroides sp. 224]
MKKIMFVFGTRPEAIKMAPLIKEFQLHQQKIETIICVTGQHREMLDQVLTVFNIRADYDLNIMKYNQDLYDITARILFGLRDILKENAPDLVLVHGDTTTSMATALAAYYQQIKIGHVEAGLRTNNIYSPWPEEINRQIVTRISSYHFAPTALSRENLLMEAVDNNKIIVTGNTVIDSLYWVIKCFEKDDILNKNLQNEILKKGYNINRQRKIILITSHRRENFGHGFRNICKAIRDLAQRYSDIDFIYPMHPNPNVRTVIDEFFEDEYLKKTTNIFFIEPLEYLSFIYLMKKSSIILTDSGGIQEEAPGLGKPVLVMREITERPEAVQAGTVKLVGTDYAKIIKEVSLLIDDCSYYQQMSKIINPYGDGKACSRIVNFLIDKL